MKIYEDIKKIKPENDLFHILNIVKPITQDINVNQLTNILIDKNDTIDVINYLEYKNYDIFLLMYLNKFVTTDFTWINQSLEQYIINFKRLIEDDIIKTIFPLCENLISQTSSIIIKSYNDLDKFTTTGEFKLDNNLNSLKNLYNIVKMTPTKSEITSEQLSTETTNSKLKYKLFLQNWFYETRLIKLIQKILLFSESLNDDCSDSEYINNNIKIININIMNFTQLLKYVVYWVME